MKVEFCRMNRRQFLIGAVGTAGMTAIIPAASGRGRGRQDLINAEVTNTGAIVATDDGFRIANQHITVDGATYHEGADGHHSVIDAAGYSGVIEGNELTIESVSGEQSGIRSTGGRVTITDNAIVGGPVSGQFLGISAIAGAWVTVEDNEIAANHRVGVLLRGVGTDGHLRRNDIVGSGPITSGWAENGIQIDQDAQASVQNNRIEGHWWDNSDWASAGVLAMSDHVRMTDNEIVGNDAGVWILGDGCQVNRNEIVVEADGSFPGFDGIIVQDGYGNRVVNN